MYTSMVMSPERTLGKQLADTRKDLQRVEIAQRIAGGKSSQSPYWKQRSENLAREAGRLRESIRSQQEQLGQEQYDYLRSQAPQNFESGKQYMGIGTRRGQNLGIRKAVSKGFQRSQFVTVTDSATGAEFRGKRQELNEQQFFVGTRQDTSPPRDSSLPTTSPVAGRATPRMDDSTITGANIGFLTGQETTPNLPRARLTRQQQFSKDVNIIGQNIRGTTPQSVVTSGIPLLPQITRYATGQQTQAERTGSSFFRPAVTQIGIGLQDFGETPTTRRVQGGVITDSPFMQSFRSGARRGGQFLQDNPERATAEAADTFAFSLGGGRVASAGLNRLFAAGGRRATAAVALEAGGTRVLLPAAAGVGFAVSPASFVERPLRTAAFGAGLGVGLRGTGLQNVRTTPVGLTRSAGVEGAPFGRGTGRVRVTYDFFGRRSSRTVDQPFIVSNVGGSRPLLRTESVRVGVGGGRNIVLRGRPQFLRSRPATRADEQNLLVGGRSVIASGEPYAFGDGRFNIGTGQLRFDQQGRVISSTGGNIFGRVGETPLNVPFRAQRPPQSLTGVSIGRPVSQVSISGTGEFPQTFNQPAAFNYFFESRQGSPLGRRGQIALTRSRSTVFEPTGTARAPSQARLPTRSLFNVQSVPRPLTIPTPVGTTLAPTFGRAAPTARSGGFFDQQTRNLFDVQPRPDATPRTLFDPQITPTPTTTITPTTGTPSIPFIPAISTPESPPTFDFTGGGRPPTGFTGGGFPLIGFGVPPKRTPTPLGGGGRGFEYRRDLTSTLFNIRGKKPKGVLSGFEIRPILR